MMPKPMLTLSQVMTKLAQKGVTKEFKMNEKGEMYLTDDTAAYQPDEMKILKIYRFEGMSNPDDNAVLYLAEGRDGALGMILDSYGSESNYPGEVFNDFIRDIPVEEREEWDFEKENI